MALSPRDVAADTEFERTWLIGALVSKVKAVSILVAALTIMLVISNLGGASSSVAPKSKVVVARGGVICRKVTGSITLSPPLRKGGTEPEIMTWQIRGGACTTAKSNVTHVSGLNVTSIVHLPNDACGEVAYSRAVKATLAWTPKSIHPTSATFSGFSFVRNSAGEEGFSMPNTGGTSSVRGSFAGVDHGRRSVVTLFTNLTIAKFAAACESVKGLASYQVVSGTAAFS